MCSKTWSISCPLFVPAVKNFPLRNANTHSHTKKMEPHSVRWEISNQIWCLHWLILLTDWEWELKMRWGQRCFLALNHCCRLGNRCMCVRKRFLLIDHISYLQSARGGWHVESFSAPHFSHPREFFLSLTFPSCPFSQSHPSFHSITSTLSTSPITLA